MKAVFIVLLVAALLVPEVWPQTKLAQSASADPCPDRQTYTGAYRNRRYGFSIIIPAGLKGYWNSARCAPDEKYGCICLGSDHGRFIPLSETEDASIQVFVGYQMESEWSVKDYENNELSGLKREREVRGAQLLSSRWIRLGKLRGRRFVVRFMDQNQSVVKDHIIALYEGVEYELILRTSARRYRRDRLEFEKVIASWRLTPRME